MIKIMETIVVEGRDDVSAVKRAVDAEVIEVNGFAVKKIKTLEKIKFAAEKTGVIILCDPDFAGEKIRNTIENYVPNVKHAYISRKSRSYFKSIRECKIKNQWKRKHLFYRGYVLLFINW